MAVIRRADFLPEAQRPYADLDEPLPLLPGSTNSQPSTVRFMLEALAPLPGQRVLDIGSGSGWTSALLGHLVGEHGEVLGLDISAPLIDFAREANASYHQPWVRFELVEPGVLGTPGCTWDRILVSADAGRLPAELTRQLGDGGRMVLPVGNDLLLVTRQDDQLDVVTLPGRWRFVPLR